MIEAVNNCDNTKILGGKYQIKEAILKKSTQIYSSKKHFVSIFMQVLTRCYTRITKNLYAALDEESLDEIIEKTIDIKGIIVVMTDLFHKLMPSKN